MIAVEKRFGPSEYEDSFGKLKKLVQTGTLATYQHMFEQLANKIPGVPEHALVSCFVSGLRTDLRKEIQVYKPQSLVQAVGLAKLFEDKSLDKRLSPKLWGEASRSDNSHGFSRVPPLPPLLPTPSSTLLPSAQKQKLPASIRRLSPSEMAARRENGLCYNCDEKFSIGHKCKGRLSFFMLDEEDSLDEENMPQGEMRMHPSF